ncbi:hypothetical protein [Mucilaginibacter sp.]|uniref:hypothetical protein n=1 Tax=Mucilaginibacter sp. TaxID=1882438 RepID=UPI0035BBED10
MVTLKNILISLSLLMITACGQSSKGNAQKKDSTKVVYTFTGPFDLAKLLLKENLPEMIHSQGIRRELKDSMDVTMLKYEVFKTSDPKALRFAGTDLSGTYGQRKNYALFHYAEDQKNLICYELTLYDQKQTDQLIGLLGKVGTLVFKMTHLPKGTIEIDVDGNEVKPEKSVRQTYRVWDNKKTGITYYLSEDGTGKKITTKLTALKKATKFGKDWISTGQLDWYKYSDSEPL